MKTIDNSHAKQGRPLYSILYYEVVVVLVTKLKIMAPQMLLGIPIAIVLYYAANKIGGRTSLTKI